MKEETLIILETLIWKNLMQRPRSIHSELFLISLAPRNSARLSARTSEIPWCYARLAITYLHFFLSTCTATKHEGANYGAGGILCLLIQERYELKGGGAKTSLP